MSQGHKQCRAEGRVPGNSPVVAPGPPMVVASLMTRSPISSPSYNDSFLRFVIVAPTRYINMCHTLSILLVLFTRFILFLCCLSLQVLFLASLAIYKKYIYIYIHKICVVLEWLWQISHTHSLIYSTHRGNIYRRNLKVWDSICSLINGMNPFLSLHYTNIYTHIPPHVKATLIQR